MKTMSVPHALGALVGGLAGRHGPQPGLLRRQGRFRSRRPHCGQVGASQGLKDPQPGLDGHGTGTGPVGRTNDGDPVHAVDSQ